MVAGSGRGLLASMISSKMLPSLPPLLAPSVHCAVRLSEDIGHTSKLHISVGNLDCVFQMFRDELAHMFGIGVSEMLCLFGYKCTKPQKPTFSTTQSGWSSSKMSFLFNHFGLGALWSELCLVKRWPTVFELPLSRRSDKTSL